MQELTDTQKTEIMQLRDEIMYHQRAAQEANVKLQMIVGQTGPVSIGVTRPIEQKPEEQKEEPKP